MLVTFAKLSLVFQTSMLFKALMEVSSSSSEILLYLSLPFKKSSFGVFLSLTTPNWLIALVLLRWKPTIVNKRKLSSKDLGYTVQYISVEATQTNFSTEAASLDPPPSVNLRWNRALFEKTVSKIKFWKV